MRNTLACLALMVALVPRPAAAQGLTRTPARAQDVATIDAIVAAFYDVISGPAGQAREWARDSTLYTAGLLFTIVSRADDGWRARRVEHGQFAGSSDAFLREGFFEREIHRATQRFGPIAHVFSTYEWRRSENGPTGGRGINSLQLFHDGRRWWIVSAMWTDEDERNPIPAELLPRR